MLPLECTLAKIRLVTYGQQADDEIVSLLSKARRESDKWTTILDLQQPPSLTMFEDNLWGDIKVSAIHVRSGIAIPKTPFIQLEEIKLPSTTGKWFKVLEGKYSWRFPPNWKFPKWLNDQLPKRKSWRLGREFSELSAIKQDSLLMEYAGLIDRGNSFKLDTSSDFCENIKCYLRYKHGGDKGIDRAIDLWQDAFDSVTHESLSVFGRDNEDTNRGKLIESIRTVGKKPVPTIDNAEEEIRDSVFMGSVSEETMANRSIVFQTFKLDKNDHKTYRKFHEGTPRANRGRIRIDEDPSDMITCGNIRGKGDLKRVAGEATFGQKSPYNTTNNFTAPPEGIAFGYSEDWEPTEEHLPIFLKNLESRGVEYILEEQIAGYIHFKGNNQGPNFRKYISNKPGVSQSFVPLENWNDKYDYKTKEKIEGSRRTIPREDLLNWIYVPSGHWLKLKDKTFFFKKKVLLSPIGNKTSRKKLEQKVRTLKEKTPNRIKDRLFIKTKKGPYIKPFWSNGKYVPPKGDMASLKDWAVWRRCWTACETIRKMLEEERWERLAFDPNLPIGEMFVSEQKILENTNIDTEEEARLRIHRFLTEIKKRIFNTSLEQDIKEDFLITIKERRLQTEECFNPEAKERFSENFESCNSETIEKEIPRQMCPRIANELYLLKVRNKYIPPVIKKKKERKNKRKKTLAQKIAWATYVSSNELESPERRSKAKDFLRRTEIVKSFSKFSFNGEGKKISLLPQKN